MKYLEVEFKYKADNISLTSFTDFCKTKKPTSVVIASGYDYFYENIDDPDAFCRHRVGPDSNQLTFKRKLSDVNNFIRTERNVDLAASMSVEEISGLCDEFGYKYNTSIFKNCFVYKYDWYTFVYYICYDTDMIELGRFVEIEMSEDHAWNSEKEAWEELLLMEKICGKGLGVTAQSRIKRSLFEMFRK